MDRSYPRGFSSGAIPLLQRTMIHMATLQLPAGGGDDLSRSDATYCCLCYLLLERASSSSEECSRDSAMFEVEVFAGGVDNDINLKEASLYNLHLTRWVTLKSGNSV